ncbi:uncharacterized protein KQ657_001588 [Scheffersomyces spartinae]|uniref:HotDog ACOT-type domain-containing protein n=1 Tax=Scheffersomyces spartinae TaxID=45513 RepID=A0A9P8AHA4_9ASCO|nr:uncharacterized protein KQ657_001588 [Scheffersomyces spartinae]KAG7192493.1 hypothetical protein KQ657_001588 [Scheffersomyces spartinae]
MLAFSLRGSRVSLGRNLARVNVSGFRYKSVHRPDNGSSQDASEAADAAPTILAEKRDQFNHPNKATWLEAMREREKQLAEGKVLDSYTYTDPITTEVGEKTRNESFTYLALPFKDDQWLCDSYINAFGRLRAGNLFQDLDALAGRIAYRHCSPAEPVNVTASVDRIYMHKKVDEISNYNFVLAGCVTWTGKSSMEITVKGYAFEEVLPEVVTQDTLPDENVFITANFTFVARNPITHKSFAINRLLPVTENDWLDYRRAESRNAKKKLAAKTQKIIQPTEEENQLVYDMWKFSKEVDLSNKKGVAFTKDTKVQSTSFMQPQYRNRHSYMIFGGYLLRNSFELAYCAAASFANAGPRFVSLDSTTFKAPVPVGSILFCEATVSYTEHIHDSEENDLPFDFHLPSTNKLSDKPNTFLNEPGTLIQVRVDTSIKSLESTVTKESGTFIYSFFVPQSSYNGAQPEFCTIIPQTFSEMMEYVEGRRRAQDTAAFVSTL